MKPILVSGIQPTGPLHIGNYLGALKNFVELQNSGKYECFFFIADYHALTEHSSASLQKKNVADLMADFLAAGLEPARSTLFIQSLVPAHMNLAWIFSTLIPVSELGRMTQYKDKVSRGISPNAGLFNYPMLMAADILIYKARFVPVGDDQDQHLEFARTIVRLSNKKFGFLFPEPKSLLTKTPRVMSLDNPLAKMSKSSPKGCVFLTDSPQIIQGKMMRAVTDSHSSLAYDPKKRPGLANLIRIYAAFKNIALEEVVRAFRKKTYAEFKKALAELVVNSLKPFQTKRKSLGKDKEVLAEAFVKGSVRAERIAGKTLNEVLEKTGLR